MADITVESGPGWVCGAAERCLADVLLPVHIADDNDLSQTERDESDCAVLLEQTEEGSPCVLLLRCSPAPSTPLAISRLLVVSEARTMELYNQEGEYCGTARGERDETHTDRADRGPFYRKQLFLDPPSSGCELKLLSLCGRSSVLVCRVVLGLRPPGTGPAPTLGGGMDLTRVQSLVEEVGSSLSPGAQSLMDMLQGPQQNQASTLSSFLPLLMGGGGASSILMGGDGASSPLMRGGGASSVLRNGPQPAQLQPPASSRPGTKPTGSDTQNTVNSELAQMMSHFLKGQGHGQALSPAPEFLPMLQSICGHVTQLRVDDERRRSDGAWELDCAMERRLEQMEQRLKEHLDRRLDALETALLSALSQGAVPGPLNTLSQGATAPVSKGGASEEPVPAAQTAVPQ